MHAPTQVSVLSFPVRNLLEIEAQHDRMTALHSTRVVRLARRVGRALALDPSGLRQVALVALLHDVGKVDVPREILDKPGPLDAQEWRIVRDHPGHGAELVAERPETAHLAASIRASHERWDGDGYPDGLSGYGIPLASRISFVCDAFDAMVSDRPYRSAMALGAALDELEREAGRQFCPTASRALVEVVGPPWRMLGRPRRGRSPWRTCAAPAFSAQRQ